MEIDELIEKKKQKMDTSISYYDDLSRISNSAIGYYLISPAYFSSMMSGTGVKLSGDFLDTGTRIHAYILEPDDFWNNYRISTVPAPKSAQQKKFVENFIANKNVEAISRAVEAFSDAFSIKGKSEDKIRTEALKMREELIEYIQEVIEDNTRERISFADLSQLKKIEDNIKNHIVANSLIYDFKETDKVYSEFHINWIDESTQLECKSLIDRLIINHIDKTIKLVDLKTTTKIHKFNESMMEFGYYRQMAFYWKAIHWYFKNVLEIDISEYSKQTYIVAISTNEFTKNEVRVFDANQKKELIDEADKLIDDTLVKMKYHYAAENNFEHTYNYHTNNGIDLL